MIAAFTLRRGLGMYHIDVSSGRADQLVIHDLNLENVIGKGPPPRELLLLFFAATLHFQTAAALSAVRLHGSCSSLISPLALLLSSERQIYQDGMVFSCIQETWRNY